MASASRKSCKAVMAARERKAFVPTEVEETSAEGSSVNKRFDLEKNVTNLVAFPMLNLGQRMCLNRLLALSRCGICIHTFCRGHAFLQFPLLNFYFSLFSLWHLTPELSLRRPSSRASGRNKGKPRHKVQGKPDSSFPFQNSQ